MAKHKIKTRKERAKDYLEQYSDIPREDPVERIMHCIGDKLTVDKVKKIIARQKEILSKMSYSCIKLIYYESPVGSNRPRHRVIKSKGTVMSYVPNAKDNKKHFEKLINKLVDDIGIIHTPMYLKLATYYPMPATVSMEESILFEAKVLHPIAPVDLDNVLKAYTDQMLELLIIDDSLIYKINMEAFYSYLPRLEMYIYYEDKFAAKYVYDKIRKRKTYERLKDKINLSLTI